MDVAPYTHLLTTSRDVEPSVRTDDGDHGSCLYNIDDGTMVIDVSVDMPAEAATAEKIFEPHRNRIDTASG